MVPFPNRRNQERDSEMDGHTLPSSGSSPIKWEDGNTFKHDNKQYLENK